MTAQEQGVLRRPLGRHAGCELPASGPMYVLIAAGLSACVILGAATREEPFGQQFHYADVNHTLVLRPFEGRAEATLGGVIT